MNDRIKELMKQAGTDTSGKWMGVDHAEKFAKLIVLECVGIAHGSDMPSKDIKEHFGIES
jgi:hypothetical protein